MRAIAFSLRILGARHFRRVQQALARADTGVGLSTLSSQLTNFPMEFAEYLQKPLLMISLLLFLFLLCLTLLLACRSCDSSESPVPGCPDFLERLGDLENLWVPCVQAPQSGRLSASW